MRAWRSWAVGAAHRIGRQGSGCRLERGAQRCLRHGYSHLGVDQVGTLGGEGGGGGRDHMYRRQVHGSLGHGQGDLGFNHAGIRGGATAQCAGQADDEQDYDESWDQKGFSHVSLLNECSGGKNKASIYFIGGKVKRMQSFIVFDPLSSSRSIRHKLVIIEHKSYSITGICSTRCWQRRKIAAWYAKVWERRCTL